MWDWLFGRKDKPSLTATKQLTDNEARYTAALELERRLYDAAIASVDQTFAKEGLVAAFLTSGAIVAFAASLQAFSQIAPHVGRKATWIVTMLLFAALALLVISIYRFALVLRGWNVQDVSDAIQFLDSDPQPVSKDEVALKLMAEYRQARINHEELVKARLKNLFIAMRWLGSATVLAFSAILVAFLSVSVHSQAIKPETTEASSQAYNKYMADKPTSQKPPPTVLPKPGSGTTMIKGGGGDGSRK